MIYFKENRYSTKDVKRSLGSRLTFASSLWFYVRFFIIVLRTRHDAIHTSYGDDIWAKNSFMTFKEIESFGGQFEIDGIDNLKKLDQPVVFISNHMSTLETLVFPSIILPYMSITYVVKNSLTKMPFFGAIMKATNPIVVNRENPREDLKTVISKGSETLSKGKSIILFPQSTRDVNFDPSKFNSLGIKLAKKANVKVLPIAIKTDFWGNSRCKPIKDFGSIDIKKTIKISFGAPIEIEGNGSSQHLAVTDFIKSKLFEWQ